MVSSTRSRKPIAEVLTLEDDPEIAADRLIRLANDNGGRDNVSLVLLQMVGGSAVTDPTAEIELVSSEAPTSKESDRAPRRTVRSRLRWGLVLRCSVGLTVGGALAATAIRSGFTVAFDSDGDVVVLRGHDVLWFAPTVEARGPAGREALDAVSRDLVESEPEFDTLDQAVDFIVERLSSEEEDEFKFDATVINERLRRAAASRPRRGHGRCLPGP